MFNKTEPTIEFIDVEDIDESELFEFVSYKDNFLCECGHWFVSRLYYDEVEEIFYVKDSEKAFGQNREYSITNLDSFNLIKG